MVAIGLLVQGVFVWLLAVAFQGQSRFAQSFSLMLHLGVIAHLKNWANFLLLHLRGMDAIRSQGDLQAPMGLDLLAGDNAALKRRLFKHQPLHDLAAGAARPGRGRGVPTPAKEGLSARRHLLGRNHGARSRGGPR